MHMARIPDTAETPLALHVPQLKTHIWHCRFKLVLGNCAAMVTHTVTSTFPCVLSSRQ